MFTACGIMHRRRCLQAVFDTVRNLFHKLETLLINHPSYLYKIPFFLHSISFLRILFRSYVLFLMLLVTLKMEAVSSPEKKKTLVRLHGVARQNRI